MKFGRLFTIICKIELERCYSTNSISLIKSESGKSISYPEVVNASDGHIQIERAASPPFPRSHLSGPANLTRHSSFFRCGLA